MRGVQKKMRDIFRIDWNSDYIGCLGEFDPQSKLCTKACALSVRCIIEYNRRFGLMDFDGLFDMDETDYVHVN